MNMIYFQPYDVENSYVSDYDTVLSARYQDYLEAINM